MEQVILVDHDDNEVGLEEKMTAHQNGGKLHRAFSIFVFNNKGETMLQQRAATKYHGAGLWSNTVCSHPRVGETPLQAAHRRLEEELGFDCNMHEVYSFEYEAKMDEELTEHEYDHVIFGMFDGEPRLNPEEVQNWKWVTLDFLKADIVKNPKLYSPWLKITMDDVVKHAKAEHPKHKKQ